MNVLVYAFYLLVLGIIYSIKWIEFQILKLFTPCLKKKIKSLFSKLGIVLHCPNDPEWTQIDSEKALAKCDRYDSLVHLKINHNSFFPRMANMGSLAIGEMYMEKVWDYANSQEEITEFLRRVVASDVMKYLWNPFNYLLEHVELIAFNLQTKQRAFQVGKKHYDLGNDLYQMMLDPWMQYTCGYWAKASDLNQAQLDKMELIAKKLDLKPGMKVLDIGCGWGYLCKYLAENYGVECVGVTISQEGVAHGKELCKGLPIDIRLQDYRDVVDEKIKFDRIVSVGMFEHVGYKNYKKYFEVVHKCLKDDGIFLLHTIGTNHAYLPRSERWLHKYIFPNGSLPRAHDITKFTYGLFIMEDWHNFGPDYAKTLHAWRDNVNANMDKIEEKYGEKFCRMWIYFLSNCKGIFLSRRTQLWQVVLSKDGLQTGYRAAR